MSQLREIAYDCALYLAEHPNELLHQLPMTLFKAAVYLTNAGVVQYTQHAIEGIEYLSRVIPLSVAIEKEGKMSFLSFYDPVALRKWVNSSVPVTGLDMSLALKPSIASNEILANEQGPENNSDGLSPVGSLMRELDPDKHPSLEGLSKELASLILEPTAMNRQTIMKALEATPNGEFTLICNKPYCSQMSSDCATKVHFERIITPSTDINLGDCSYLDTCYKGKSCKYVHYKVLPPSKPTLYRTPDFGMRIPAQTKPQHIQCDIRKLDFSKLGNQYAVIIVDPPWDIHMNSNSTSSEVSINDNEVLSLDVGRLQDEGVIFLWVTGRVLDLGRKCLYQWGYKHIEEIIWCKTNQLGRTICTGRTGHWLNHSKEHCLVGLKGDPAWINRQVDTDTIVSTTRGKSQKPQELYGIIDRMVGPNSKKIELFGRKNNLRPGWLTVGKELPGTNVFDPSLSEFANT